MRLNISSSYDELKVSAKITPLNYHLGRGQILIIETEIHIKQAKSPTHLNHSHTVFFQTTCDEETIA